MGSGFSNCRKPRPHSDEVVVPAQSSVAAVNSFGLRMLQALQPPEGSTASVFISPLSISSSLVRVALGATAEGAAKKQLMGLWGLQEGDADAFARDLRNVDRTLLSFKSVKLLTANSIWCSKAIKASYKATLAKLGTEAMQLNGVGPVNAWVSKATEGMIPTILTTLDPETVAAIVNAVYFKGTWQDEFEMAATRLGTFRSAGGEKPCAMMARFDSQMRYTEYKGAQVAELPYKGGNVTAMVVLPKQGQESLGELSELLKLLATGDALSSVAASLQPTEVGLKMPRFKLEFGIRDLKKELLHNFGLTDAFNGSGQFLSMADDPSVSLSNVFHKAVVEVNEEGTKAAAATAAVMARGGLSLTAPQPKEMIVDHPFLFLIRERDTGVLLFAGTVVEPELDTAGL